MTGTYKLYGGKRDSIIVTLNHVGTVTYCDDKEQIYGTPTHAEPHRGDKAEFFEAIGYGHYKAKPEFFQNARKLN